MNGPLQIDFEQAKRYLNLLDPQASEFVFQTFDDSKSRKDPRLAGIKGGSFQQVQAWLAGKNGSGAGVFVTVNETDGKGRKLENITRIRAIWHEEDTSCGIDFPVEPHITIESSPGKFHRYWLCEGLTRDDFAGIMRRMVQDYGSDPNARDLARVLRVPGFYHQKDPTSPFKVRIVDESGAEPYTRDEMLAFFPPILNDAPKNTAQSQRNADTAEDGIIKSRVAELASRAARHTWEDKAKGRHSQVLWLGYECAYQGIPIEYGQYALQIFGKLMRGVDTTGKSAPINFAQELKAFNDAYQKGLNKPRNTEGSYQLLGTVDTVLVVCVDLPSGKSIQAATAYAVAVVESAASMLAAAKALRRQYPAVRMLFADWYQAKDEEIPRSSSKVASDAVGGVVITPSFNQGELQSNPRSFYDLHRLRGLEAVANAFKEPSDKVTTSSALSRKDLESLIDQTDDFDVLTERLVAQVLASGLPLAAREFLLSKIAKKVGVPKASLHAVIDEAYVKKKDSSKLSDDDRLVLDLNQKHAVVPVCGRVLIANREYDRVMRRTLLTFSSKSDFETRYCNRKVYDRGEEVGLGTFWVNHPQRAQYDGVGFLPGDSQSEDFLNLWTQWGVEPKPGACDKYLDFVADVICGGNSALFDYIIRWCAHLVQRPQELPETALVFRGKEGVGKNTFIDPLMDIVGREHSLILTSMSQVTGRFSGHLANALLVFCNESIWGGDKSAQGALKSMISDQVQPIESKGRDITQVQNFKRLIFATNENWAVPRGADDRRYVVADVLPLYKGNYAYFSEIKKEMDEGGKEALMHFLLTTDISNWNPRMIPAHLSERGWELKIRSGGSVVQWYFDVLTRGWLQRLDAHFAEDEREVWPSLCPVDVVQQSYVHYCTQYKIAHIEIPCVVGRSLSEWGLGTSQPSRDNPKRKRFYKLPSLDEARAIFSKQFTIPLSIWNDHEDGSVYL